jgi:signal transduction histidine kinase
LATIPRIFRKNLPQIFEPMTPEHTYPIPANEEQRLQELYNFDILDTPYEVEFDEVVRLASQICCTSISTITLIDSTRQWFKAQVGMDSREGAREFAFCSHVIASEKEVYEIGDASQNEIFANNPLVTGEPNIRFYAAVPLVSSNGFKLGTLCVIDPKPMLLNDEQTFALKVLGRQVMKQLELRIKNKQLDKNTKRLQQQAELQNRIISIIAHDVRNPVASLKNIIELSHSNIISEEEAKELTLMADSQLDGTIKLLSDLVDWGKMQMVAHKLELEKIHLRALVAEKFKKFHVEASMKKNKFINLVDDDLLIYSDPHAIRFILRNLISNANKFTSDGAISVYAHKDNDKVLITVNDTGVGMTEKVRQKLFEDGGKHTSLGTNKEKGSGLGLMLTKDFIELLDGSLTVQSQLGKGTTISIELKR